jgi:hypothetical protein
MDIIKGFNEPNISKYVYGENGCTLKYVDETVIVTNRKAKYDSLAVHTDKLLGEKEAYKTRIKFKLAQGYEERPFIIAHKFTVEYIGLEYTMYDLSKSVMLSSSAWTETEQTLNIPTGSKILSVISYFIQNGKTDDFPDVIVKEFVIEEAEAAKAVTAERKKTPIRRQERTTFGAIRWDAYMETGLDKSFVSDQVARSLSPREYHRMAPFFTKVTDIDKVEFPPETQAQFDKEAELAIKAGIDYFAYCWYSDDNPMSYARKQHLTSKFKNDIKMCAIFGVSRLDEGSMLSLGKAMTEDCYLRFDNRPVVYLYDAFRMTADMLTRIENAAREAGVNEPVYFIGMASDCSPFIVNEYVLKGIDAIGAYSCGPKTANEEYDVIAERAEAINAQKYSFHNIIDIAPLVLCGRDTSPRIAHPVSWAGDYGGNYAKTPTGEQLYKHVSRVLEGMRKEKEHNIPNTVIAYAWNEHDEGGWCCPTIAVDDEGQPILDVNGVPLMNATNLNAIARALKEHRELE